MAPILLSPPSCMKINAKFILPLQTTRYANYGCQKNTCFV